MALPQFALMLFLSTLQPITHTQALERIQETSLVETDPILQTRAFDLTDKLMKASPDFDSKLAPSPGVEADQNRSNPWFGRREQEEGEQVTGEPETASLSHSIMCELPYGGDYALPPREYELAFCPQDWEPDSTAGYRASLESRFEPWYLAKRESAIHARDSEAVEIAEEQPEGEALTAEASPRVDSEQLALHELEAWNDYYFGPWRVDASLNGDAPNVSDGVAHDEEHIDECLAAEGPQQEPVFNLALASQGALRRFSPNEMEEEAAPLFESAFEYADYFGNAINNIEAVASWNLDELMARLSPSQANDVALWKCYQGLSKGWLAENLSTAWITQAEQWVDAGEAALERNSSLQWLAAQGAHLPTLAELSESYAKGERDEQGEAQHAASHPRERRERLNDVELGWLLGASSAAHRLSKALDDFAYFVEDFASKEIAAREREPHLHVE